ncbi:HupE/UreJ family protein [Mongoliimonas terrestris]|uniref:HupE/UreJ family protein n=1 Tax=Mongoliimonas terrestris TaxID=1709001 RepID=UPI000949568A|nr:HupE/UreJ family protein [Mongoliimonas terrestris]
MNRLASPTLAALLAVVPTVALAHTGGDHVHGFEAGLSHPILGVDHLLAMVAIGLVSARAGGAFQLRVPAGFLGGMGLGALLAMGGVAIPFAEQGIAGSLVILGVLLAVSVSGVGTAGARLVALAGLFGFLHGFAHGTEVPESGSGLAYAAGFLLTTAGLHTAGVLAGRQVLEKTMVWRVGGVALSAAGLAFATGAV